MTVEYSFAVMELSLKLVTIPIVDDKKQMLTYIVLMLKSFVVY